MGLERQSWEYEYDPAVDRLEERVERLEKALRLIDKCECTFSLDRLEHAHNAVEYMRKIAREALKGR